MANQSVGTPRFYVDFTQLARLKGDYFWSEDYQSAINITDDEDGQRPHRVWNFDFYDVQTYQVFSDTEGFGWKFTFNPNSPISRLISVSNWAGVFNHKLASDLSTPFVSRLNAKFFAQSGVATDHYNVGDFTDSSIPFDRDYNASLVEKNGFSLFEFPSPDTETPFIEFWLLNYPTEVDVAGGISLLGKTVDIGAIGFGRYYDMPQAPDLSVKKSIEYEGVKIQRTLGGGDYVQIDNFGTPDWISGEPWALVHPDESNLRLGRHGRRSWQLSFSYISNDDLFFDTNRLNSFADLEFIVEETERGSRDNIVTAGTEIQQIFDLTMCGGLSFVFTPDKDADNPEFAQCRIDQKSLKATQIAHQCWDISMNIVEVW